MEKGLHSVRFEDGKLRVRHRPVTTALLVLAGAALFAAVPFWKSEMPGALKAWIWFWSGVVFLLAIHAYRHVLDFEFDSFALSYRLAARVKGRVVEDGGRLPPNTCVRIRKHSLGDSETLTVGIRLSTKGEDFDIPLQDCVNREQAEAALKEWSAKLRLPRGLV